MNYSTLFKMQEWVEQSRSKRNVKEVIMTALFSNQDMQYTVDKAIQAVINYASDSYEYEPKMIRLAQLKYHDLESIVTDIIYNVVRVNRMETLTTISGLIASSLNYEDIEDALTTAGELVAVVSTTNLYTLIPASRGIRGQWSVRPLIKLDDKTQSFVDSAMYLPPMLVPPKKLIKNTDSAHLTIKHDSLILGGKKKHHDKPISLHCLNRMNQVSYSLDVDFLKTISNKIPAKLLIEKSEPELEEKRLKSVKYYKRMLKDQVGINVDLVKSGNKFYFPHKTDNRGRKYSQGYHVNVQGNDFSKAALNFSADYEEVIEIHD